MSSLPPRPASAAIQGRSGGQRHPSSAIQKYCDASSSSAADSDVRSTSMMQRRTYADVAEQHHHSIVQLLRDKKREHVDVTLHAAVNPAHTPSSFFSPAAATRHGAWSSDEGNRELRTPSIAGLMDECRRRKLGRVKSEHMQFTEVLYRERVERSWFQGWWLLWQRLMAQYIEDGSRNTMLEQRMSVSRVQYSKRRTVLRRDLARSLEKLSRTTHLAQRFVSWLQYHMSAREEHATAQLRKMDLMKTKAATRQMLNSHATVTDDAPAPPQTTQKVQLDQTVDDRSPSNASKQLNASSVTSTSEATCHSPTRFRGYVVEDPWSPSVALQSSSIDAAQAPPCTRPPSHANPSGTDPRRIGGGEPNNSYHSNDERATGGYATSHPGAFDSSGTNGISVSSAHSHTDTAACLHYHTFHDDRTQTVVMVPGAYYGSPAAAPVLSRASPVSSVEVIALDAVESHSRDLLTRHLRKICKITGMEEAALRVEATNHALSFILSRNVEMSWILSRLTSVALLHQFCRQALSQVESSLREELLLVENSCLIELVVTLRLERHALMIGESPPRQTTTAIGAASAPVAALSSCGIRLVTSPPGSPEFNMNFTSPEDTVLASSSCAASPPPYKEANALGSENAGALLPLVKHMQCCARGYLARMRLQRFYAFWKVDRCIREDLWRAFSKGLIILAGRLASFLADDRLSKQKQLLRFALHLQRVCRGHQHRQKLKQTRIFWSVDSQVRSELFLAWGAKCSSLVTLCNSSIIVIANEERRRVLLQLDEEAERANGVNGFNALHSRSKHAALALQRIGRAFIAKKHLFQIRSFWLIDTSIRAEVFSAWSRKAELLGRANSRTVLRLEERAARASITLSSDQWYLQLSHSKSVDGKRSASAASLIQRYGRAFIARKHISGLLKFWLVDANVRAEAFTAWRKRASRIAHFCETTCRLAFTEEPGARCRIQEEERESLSEVSESWKTLLLLLHAEVQQRTAHAQHFLSRICRGFIVRRNLTRQHLFWAVDLSVRKDLYDAWSTRVLHHYHAFQRGWLEISETVQRSYLEDCRDRDTEEFPQLMECQWRRGGDTDGSVLVCGDDGSDVDVSDDDNQFSKGASGAHGTPDIAAGDNDSDVDVTSNEDSEEEDVSSDEGNTNRTSDYENVVDVSSEDNDEELHHCPVSPGGVASADVEQQPAEEKHDTADIKRSSGEGTPQSAAHSIVESVPLVSHQMHSMSPPSDSDSTVVIGSDDEDDAEISDDDDDNLSAPSRVELLVRVELAVRLQLQEDEGRDRVVMQKRHNAELAAVAEVDDGSDDGNTSFHLDSPQENGVDLATPAKSDSTHPPHSTRKGERTQQRKQQRAQSSLSHSNSDDRGAFIPRNPSTSSSVTLLLKHSTSGQNDDCVEIVSSDGSSSIEVTSDDDDDEVQTSSLGGHMSSVKDIYMRIFADQRSKLEVNESTARLDIVLDLEKIQLSLLSAQEYLVRHSTVVHSRNRFARSMLDTKHKLTEMTKMQLGRTASRLQVSQHPPPRGSWSRTRSNSSDTFSLASAGPSPDSVAASKNSSMVIGSAPSMAAILRDVSSTI